MVKGISRGLCMSHVCRNGLPLNFTAVHKKFEYCKCLLWIISMNIITVWIISMNFITVCVISMNVINYSMYYTYEWRNIFMYCIYTEIIINLNTCQRWKTSWCQMRQFCNIEHTIIIKAQISYQRKLNFYKWNS